MPSHLGEGVVKGGRAGCPPSSIRQPGLPDPAQSGGSTGVRGVSARSNRPVGGGWGDAAALALEGLVRQPHADAVAGR